MMPVPMIVCPSKNNVDVWNGKKATLNLAQWFCLYLKANICNVKVGIEAISKYFLGLHFI